MSTYPVDLDRWISYKKDGSYCFVICRSNLSSLTVSNFGLMRRKIRFSKKRAMRPVFPLSSFDHSRQRKTFPFLDVHFLVPIPVNFSERTKLFLRSCGWIGFFTTENRLQINIPNNIKTVQCGDVVLVFSFSKSTDWEKNMTVIYQINSVRIFSIHFLFLCRLWINYRHVKYKSKSDF